MRMKSTVSTTSSTNPADVIANALRKKFAKVRRSIGSPAVGKLEFLIGDCSVFIFSFFLLKMPTVHTAPFASKHTIEMTDIHIALPNRFVNPVSQHKIHC